MMKLLRRSAQRFYLKHPWQLALAIAGIALGVAVYVGVALANDSASRAFDLAASVVRGQTTHRLLPVGAALDESIYREIVLHRGITAAAPVIELEIGLPTGAGRPWPALGIDPLKESSVRGFTGFVPGAGSDFGRLIAEPGSVLLPSSLAAELGVRQGSIAALVAGRPRTLEVIGVVEGEGLALEADPPIVMDIATAQELLGRTGISRIDLSLDAATAEALRSNPPAGSALVAVAEQDAAFDELAGAFRTNLTALGLLALMVGLFLIYGTMSFAVLQRRSTLGVLRALGLERRDVVRSVLVEAAALGVAATTIGLVLGHALAAVLVDLVLRTIGDLYFTAAVAPAAPSPWLYVQGGVLGMGATLLAGLKPAADAARAEPAAEIGRAALERGSRRGALRAALIAVPIAIGGGLLLLATERSLYVGFFALFCVLAAGALLTPAVTIAVMKAAESPARRLLALPGLLAVRGVTASLSRTGVAAAALAVAVATVVGVGLMIESFRRSLESWLDTTLSADLYVTLDRATDAAAWTDERIAAIEAIEGVEGVGYTRAVDVPTEAGAVTLRAVRPGPRGWGLDIAGERDTAVLQQLEAGSGIVISERLAFARGLDAGQSFALPTASGPRNFAILGIFRDYNTGGYSLVMPLDLYERHWSAAPPTGIGVALEEDADEDTVEAAIRAALPAGASARARSSRAIKALSLEVFDRTFKVTEVLRVLAAVIAFLGVLSALLSIELERARELAVLRALGFMPRELGVMLIVQTTLLGVAAAAAALPLGTALAALLVQVINRRSFGWTMEFVPTAGPLVGGIALAVLAALLAGVYPARRASRMELAAALREE
jgi:putative ABC transport system permease protein